MIGYSSPVVSCGIHVIGIHRTATPGHFDLHLSRLSTCPGHKDTLLLYLSIYLMPVYNGPCAGANFEVVVTYNVVKKVFYSVIQRLDVYTMGTYVRKPFLLPFIWKSTIFPTIFQIGTTSGFNQDYLYCRL